MTGRLLILLLAVALGGCATGTGRPVTMADMDIIARDERFALVRLKPGQDIGSVASAFYGDALEAWQLREANAAFSGRPGEVLAVPLQPLNASAVYPDGFRVLPILCYHQFTRERESDNRLVLNAQAFEEQIRYLVFNDYQVLSFAELDDIIRAGRPIPERAVVITIDDGYRSVYEVAWPILQEYQVPATLFIYTDFIGGGAALSWSQIREMQASGLVEVQSHGKSHTSLARLPGDASPPAHRARVEGEINQSDAIFQRRLGYKPIYHSYPFGDSSDAAEKTLKREGYVLAATVTRGDNTVFSDPYLLHRTMIYSDNDLADFARVVRTWRVKSLQ